MHWLKSSPQTLPNTANNGIKQITKKTFQLYQCCANNFFEEIFLLTIFWLIFCMQTVYFTKMGPPARKIMVRPLVKVAQKSVLSPYNIIENSPTSLAHTSVFVNPNNFRFGTETRMIFLDQTKIWGKLIIISMTIFLMTSYANHQ